MNESSHNTSSKEVHRYRLTTQ